MIAHSSNLLEGTILFTIMSKQSVLVCPFCGELQKESKVCQVCQKLHYPRGVMLAEAEMGPWWIRREKYPFRPGLKYDNFIDLVRTGEINTKTIIRGPTTKQLWKIAGRVQGIAHLLGRCHACGEEVKPTALSCGGCSAQFFVYRDRNNLGLDQSNPSEGEVVGKSCFISDESIFETQSAPLQMPNLSAQNAEQESGTIGSPQFRSVQRLLELSKKKNTLLTVSLATAVVVIGILIVLIVKN